MMQTHHSTQRCSSSKSAGMLIYGMTIFGDDIYVAGSYASAPFAASTPYIGNMEPGSNYHSLV